MNHHRWRFGEFRLFFLVIGETNHHCRFVVVVVILVVVVIGLVVVVGLVVVIGLVVVVGLVVVIVFRLGIVVAAVFRLGVVVAVVVRLGVVVAVVLIVERIGLLPGFRVGVRIFVGGVVVVSVCAYRCGRGFVIRRLPT